MTNELQFRQESETILNQDKIWVDPVVGINAYMMLDENYALRFGGDYGGFGVASDSTWQAYGALDLSLTPKASFTLGYRGMAHNYDKGSFKYDIVMKGPMFGFNFKF